MSLPDERVDILRELGQEVQIRREELGLTYDDIYERTRIQPSYLYAIENATYEVLPDAVYTLGFIRTYLGIIEFDEIYPEFRQWLLVNTRTSGRDKGGMLPYASHPPGFKLASRFWIFVVLMLIIFGAMTYVTYSWSKNGIPNIPSRNEQRAEKNDLFIVSDDASGDLEVDSGDLSIDIPIQIPEPVPEPEPVKPSLQIKATDDCWLSVRVGNEKITDRTLRKGETYRMELTAMTRVSYGRPWAVTVIHNDKDIGSPYKSGAKRPQVNLYYPDGRSSKVESN
ncbi:MAG: DUF4115 domain-containing protein [Synergistaceae bacterium]|nr:DUF4115 domain-containing protein [Synergistaceae bacterium]